MTRGAIFDMDGVLVDAESFRHAQRQRYGPPMDQSAATAVIEQPGDLLKYR